mmetsp:Transcript_39335/g.76366  ORF Transcript_39335/g.76366 Transcript_39335/m.76366 type:complete len:110 (-) Transcript_39335:68-397(-)
MEESLTSAYDSQSIVWNSSGQLRVGGVIQARRHCMNMTNGNCLDVCVNYSTNQVSIFCHETKIQHTHHISRLATYAPFFALSSPQCIKVTPLSADVYLLPMRRRLVESE